jgi:hypothetical protein
MPKIKSKKSLFIQALMIKATRRFLYIDLGANTGDSVYNFFGHQSNYPKFFNSTDVDKNEWIVYAFEANPRFNDQLDQMKSNLTSSRREINLFKSTAAWIYNGNITFYLDTVSKANNYWGSSLVSNNPYVEKSNKTHLTVPCVDNIKNLK